MSFIRFNNPFEFEKVDLSNNEITLLLGVSTMTFNWIGSVKFFNDGNGVGEFWTDAECDFDITLLINKSDEYIPSFNSEDVIEHILEQEYLYQINEEF